MSIIIGIDMRAPICTTMIMKSLMGNLSVGEVGQFKYPSINFKVGNATRLRDRNRAGAADCG